MRFTVVASLILAFSLHAVAADEMNVTLKPDPQGQAAKEPTGETKENQIPVATEATGEKLAETDCKALAADLKAMREAQTFMLNSMIRKNNSLAETLDLFAKDFSAKKGQLKKLDFQKMKRSADAFRGHADRERGLVSRFENSADELVTRVQKCLEASPIASQTSEQRTQN